FHMVQYVIPAAQLVPEYKPIGRCNNYAVLQSIPYSPECKIRTVSKVPNTKDTIKFLLDTKKFVYTMDMFRDTHQLLVETPENLFVTPANIHTIEAFMNRVGYQGVVDKDMFPCLVVYTTEAQFEDANFGCILNSRDRETDDLIINETVLYKYVTHPSSIVDYDDEYQGELQGDSQKDKLTTAMILLARAISQKFSSPTNNRLRVSSNIKNKAVVQDGRVDIQTKNASYDGIGNKNLGRNRNQMFHAGNASDESNQIVHKPKVHDAKCFREQMLLAMKDEAGSHLNNEENDFMLHNAYGEESLDELTASLMLMARL
ncbi:hypothetical protein Tco_0168696, partial [Tanacetum coccineum]